MSPFQLLIKPVGDRCNLRCRYCFYSGTEDRLAGAVAPDRRRAGTMSEDILAALVREFLSYRMPQSIFCWQGGEPTLAGLDFFRRVVALQVDHGARGQVVGNAFQTNGVLIDREWARFLAEYKFLVGLSLDGPREVHEAMRGNSFDAAMRAAQLLRQFGVEFNILCVVSRANAGRGAEVYRWLVDRGFHNIQFIPCHEVRDDGTPTAESIAGREFGDFLIAAFEEWWKDDVHRVSERNIDSALAFHLRGEPGMCTYQVRCSDYLLIERGGEVFPCDFFGLPEWLLGYVGEIPLREFVAQAREARFGQLKAGVADACRSCEWWPACHGGCPRDRAPDGRSHYCDGYRAFFSATAVRLRQLAASMKKR